MDGKQGIQEVNRNKELLPKKINQKKKKNRQKLDHGKLSIKKTWTKKKS